MSFLSTKSATFAVSAPDQRADGGVRTIRFNRRGVRIERFVEGIKMYLALPIQLYEGVALSCEARADQHLCKVALVHHDPELCVLLHEAPESPAILTVWRNWADFFSKPALYREGENGGLKTRQGAALRRPRRRGTSLCSRRPRFLKRRRCGAIGQ